MINNEVERLFTKPEVSIRTAMSIIDKGSKGIALVVNDNGVLLGTITDGDIRRAILKGISLENPVNNIMNENFIFVTPNYSRTLVETIFKKKHISQIPVVDDNMKVIELLHYYEFYNNPSKENWVVIMAGGMGTRLYPLTKEMPKPMLKIGNKPILEIIIEQLKSFGYKNIIISLNYKGQIIESYFRDGSSFGVNIEYIHEKKRLGTAGALKLAKRYLTKPFIVMNGDLLTKINFQHFMEYHKENKFAITIGTKKYDIDVPYGVLDINKGIVENLREKPKLEFFINGGIYCISPGVIEYIPDDQYYDITELINRAKEKKHLVGSFPIREYWLDIGQITDYKQALQDYQNIFRSEASATKE